MLLFAINWLTLLKFACLERGNDLACHYGMHFLPVCQAQLFENLPSAGIPGFILIAHSSQQNTINKGHAAVAYGFDVRHPCTIFLSNLWLLHGLRGHATSKMCAHGDWWQHRVCMNEKTLTSNVILLFNIK